MMKNFVNLSRICVLLIGLSVHQSKSESIRNGIIMNGANETEDSGNTALADVSIDKNAIQEQSVDDVIRPINGSTQQQQQQIEQHFDDYLATFLASHSRAIVVKPTHKIDNINETFRFPFPNTENIEVIIHLLDVNPYINFLSINSTFARAEPQSLKISEHIQPPNVKTLTFHHIRELSIYFEFANSEWSHYQGFVLTYQPFETNSSGINKSLDNDVKPVEKLNVLIEVPEAQQVNETWHLFRKLLANSTNKFINGTGINAEKCSEDNVTFVNITACRATWTNAQNCIEIDFSIRLKLLPKKENATNALNDSTTDTADYLELSHDKLLFIWVQFGRTEFQNNGFKEFPEPDTKRLLFLWASICLAIIGAFLLVLLGIWKMDVLRDYRRMYWKSADDEKQICKSDDVYPPVHLIVPTLFPNDVSGTINTENPFEYVNKPISFDISDFKRRSSIEESQAALPSGNMKRKAGEVPFQCDTEFNESKQDHPEDEVYFSNSNATSPRLVN